MLLALPGDARAETVDAAGQQALAVLRALGMPTLVGLVQLPDGAAAGKNALKERSAAKKHAAAAFEEHVSGLGRARWAGQGGSAGGTSW